VPSRRGHSRAGHLGTLRARIIAALQEFGPTTGAAVVRSGAAPAAISVPGGAIAFTSPSDLQTKVDANPSGTDFVSAGSMLWTSGVSIPAKAAKIWMPTAHVIDGNGAQIIGLNLGAGSELHGGTWINFGSVGGQLFHRPVMAGGNDPWTGPVLVEDAIFHDNYETALHAQCSNATFRRCLLYNNGRYGWGASLPALGAPIRTGLRVENCQWYGNNSRHLNTADDAGGNKVTGNTAAYIGRCWSYNNYGSGIWTDFASGQHIIEENVVEGNRNWGIFYEVGSGQVGSGGLANAIIRHNFLKDNANADAGGQWFNEVQVLASCSDGLAAGGVGFEVHNNYIDGFFKAIGFIDHDQHPTAARGMHTHDNDIWLRGSVSGGPAFVGGSKEGTRDPFAPAANNTFVRNRYHVTDAALLKWRWNNTALNWAQWQAAGNDLEGTLLVDA